MFFSVVLAFTFVVFINASTPCRDKCTKAAPWNVANAVRQQCTWRFRTHCFTRLLPTSVLMIVAFLLVLVNYHPALPRKMKHALSAKSAIHLCRNVLRSQCRHCLQMTHCITVLLYGKQCLWRVRQKMLPSTIRSANVSWRPRRFSSSPTTPCFPILCNWMEPSNRSCLSADLVSHSTSTLTPNALKKYRALVWLV